MTGDVAVRLRARVAALSAVQSAALARALGVDASEERADLVAYVATSGAATTADELRDFLGAKLPEYMIPRRFVFLDALPRTAAGKLDRGALSDLPGAAPPPGPKTVTGPRTETERALTEIWKVVLGTDEIDVHDDFFELGGDSILSIRAIARANEAGLKITAQQFFASPTVADLAALMESPPD